MLLGFTSLKTESIALGVLTPVLTLQNKLHLEHLQKVKLMIGSRLEDVTAHTLRHSFAKNLVDPGTPIDQVATPLGHESLDTTRIYTQPSERDLERAVRRAAGEIVDSK